MPDRGTRREGRALLHSNDAEDDDEAVGSDAQKSSSGHTYLMWIGSALLLLALPAMFVFAPPDFQPPAPAAPSSVQSVPERKLSQQEAMDRVNRWKRQHQRGPAQQKRLLRRQKRQQKREEGWVEEKAEGAATSTVPAAPAVPTSPTAPSFVGDGPLVRTHIVPQGGALSIECRAGTYVRSVRFASFGTPITNLTSAATGQRQVAVDPRCHSRRSQQVVADACVGQSHCCLPIGTDNFRDDPCRGTVKTLAVTIEGCDELVDHTRFKRHCSLMGQPLLCDEDVEFLATLSLPAAPQPLLPHVAIMVDTSFRPHLQHYVVHNVRNHTGWHVQLFHGPSNGEQLRALFADLVAIDAISFTDLGSDYMEDWQRLSSMMLIDNFWESVRGEKALVFQPDSAMCAGSERKITDYVQYDYVGAPMAGPWWMTNDMDSQWSVGCGGFSLRDRTKSILMSRTPECVTPAAGKLEDQQLGTMWKYLQARCANAGITVSKPSRFEAVKFGVEYDLQMDVLPGEDPSMPNGCRAKYYTGPRYDPGHRERGKPPKWHPQPMPADVQCEWKHFVPMGCHKCWHWNWRTWKHIREHCPEAVRMRKLRALYKVSARAGVRVHTLRRGCGCRPPYPIQQLDPTDGNSRPLPTPSPLPPQPSAHSIPWSLSFFRSASSSPDGPHARARRRSSDRCQ